jgi:hypothetical protein
MVKYRLPRGIFRLRKLLHKLNKRFIDGLHEQLNVTRTGKSRAVLIKSTELRSCCYNTVEWVMFDLAVTASRVSQDRASLGKRHERFTKGYITVKPT